MQRRCLGREDIDRPRTELPLRVLLCPSTSTRAPNSTSTRICPTDFVRHVRPAQGFPIAKIGVSRLVGIAEKREGAEEALCLAGGGRDLASYVSTTDESLEYCDTEDCVRGQSVSRAGASDWRSRAGNRNHCRPCGARQHEAT